MIQNGKRDTAKVRQKLTEAGITGERLKQLARKIDPNAGGPSSRPETHLAVFGSP
ncbi:MAG: hypothetical protein Ct9H300mP1_09480 [Planctomycetaceae bacterium]|nr:MAG: hypothetical protein Ct9H300mP1_09480 [Planctomycetaceae bacterium]